MTSIKLSMTTVEVKASREDEKRALYKGIMHKNLKKIENQEKTVAQNERKIVQDAKKVVKTSITQPPMNLRAAARVGDSVQVIELLRKGFLVDEIDHEGNTPLIYAIQNNHFKVATILISNGAKVNHVTKFGFTPLMFAAWKGHVDIVTLLLKHNANVNAVNAHHDTALHFASLSGFPMVCLLLRKAGADMGVKNDRMKTPMDNAAAHMNDFKVSAQGRIPEEQYIRRKSTKNIFNRKKMMAKELGTITES